MSQTSGQETQQKQGDKVRFHWTSDEPVLPHIDGYDIIVSLSPGVPSEITFEAHTTGRFPITSHGFSTPGPTQHAPKITLLYLEVYPN